MNRYFKVEGNIIYPDKQMLTWGSFYYHSYNKAKEKMNEILEWIINWVNEKDSSLNIQPEDLIKTHDNRQIVFHIKAWKDKQTLQDCDAIITVDNIFFEDESVFS